MPPKITYKPDGSIDKIFIQDDEDGHRFLNAMREFVDRIHAREATANGERLPRSERYVDPIMSLAKRIAARRSPGLPP
jgi:hypothetical protein